MAIQEIYDAVMEYDDTRVVELINQELDAGTDVKTILDEGMIAAMDMIGKQFSGGTLFVPEMLMAAEAVQAGLDVLRPHLVGTGTKPAGTVVLGTVRGDLHDIGKNLVGLMLEGGGFRVVDLGVDVDAETFITTAQENEADIIALSSLLTTSMPEMEKAVAAISEANENRNLNIKVMVGGPPINQNYADKIGAHGYGLDAPGAVALARTLVGD
ncbi:MAG: corrinoid protein [Rhodospirillales bacterium]|jgi:5-methyltetrahydrofolate--homocysteine methyltransferase|nr:corrinoid protein [Rhodospirillales bacterium]